MSKRAHSVHERLKAYSKAQLLHVLARPQVAISIYSCDLDEIDREALQRRIDALDEPLRRLRTEAGRALKAYKTALSKGRNPAPAWTRYKATHEEEERLYARRDRLWDKLLAIGRGSSS